MKMASIIVFLLLLSPLAFARCGCSGTVAQSTGNNPSQATNANVTVGIEAVAGAVSTEKPEIASVTQELVLVTEDNTPMYVANMTAIPLSIKTDPVSAVRAVEMTAEATVSIMIDPAKEEPVSVSKIKVFVAEEGVAISEEWLELPTVKESECIEKCRVKCFGASAAAGATAATAITIYEEGVTPSKEIVQSKNEEETEPTPAEEEKTVTPAYEGPPYEPEPGRGPVLPSHYENWSPIPEPEGPVQPSAEPVSSGELPVARAVIAVTEAGVAVTEVAEVPAGEVPEPSVVSSSEEDRCFEECLKECYEIVSEEQVPALIAGEEEETLLPVPEATSVEVAVETLEGAVTVEIMKMPEEEKLIVSAEGEVAVSSEPMTVKEGKIHIVTSPAVERPVNILPYEVEGKIEEKIKHVTVKEMELKTVEEEATYIVKAEKEAKLLLVLPVTMSVEAEVSAETGEVVKTTQPWWGFLAVD